MITAISAEPPLPGGTYMTEFRNRPVTGERTVLPNSAPAAPRPHGAGNNTRHDADPEHQPAEPRDHSAMFAAAVIAGQLPPTPQTMEELMLRIGISPIPEESQARLRDLLA